MSETIERTVGDLTIRLDRANCSGFGHCAEDAPDAFALDDDNLVIFGRAPEKVARDHLIHASAVCPVEAISVFDSNGNQIVP